MFEVIQRLLFLSVKKLLSCLNVDLNSTLLLIYPPSQNAPGFSPGDECVLRAW